MGVTVVGNGSIFGSLELQIVTKDKIGSRVMNCL